ncbi:putative M18 family aminopeptidase 2 [Corynebacterium ciconiae DSM 44920]|uniref:M18 family aminopeptidase n=1 Tax=Corynebacterium ciconiae TaxID=227319 RepID=UPI00036B162C|nr:M18 family aminopeptidase [Corynebacterium ciconiae]WKD61187.1 putative M18 family aminopeptidase 2 [Corynebacterium ciconiae DSM 44920]
MTSFSDFLLSSPSSFHAARSGAELLAEAGFRPYDRTEAFDASPGGHYLVRGGALLAWWVPAGATSTSPLRIIGSHTDSPGFKLKPHADSYQHGWNQVEVEVYGGPIFASWLDRDLALAGELVLHDATTRLVHTSAIARIPHLAIHLSRDNDISLNKQTHLHPIAGFGRPDQAVIVEELARCAEVAPEDIASFDVITVDAQPPALIGADHSMLAAGRLDNLSSLYPSLLALRDAAAEEPEHIMVLASFDHEEVGSQSPTGAGGPLLEELLGRLNSALGGDKEDYHQMLSKASCLSADAAHAVHPNYADKHAPGHLPQLGEGPVTKINANQRYATTARTWALWEQACRSAGVNCQQFVGRNDVPCGSTIGPISATRLGIDTVDVGVPMLSMHSARELAAPKDVEDFATAMRAYLLS